MDNLPAPGVYLREHAQSEPDGLVRVEVVEVTTRCAIAIPIEPIPDAAIGDGRGTWSARQLKNKVEEIVGSPVKFWPANESAV